jgi:hypothetical protein
MVSSAVTGSYGSQNRTSVGKGSTAAIGSMCSDLLELGVSDGIRTHDIQDHNLAL